jgi:hypothetical protein
MTDMNPKEAFFRYLKNHNLFVDFEFLDSPVEGQEIIAVKDNNYVPEDGVVIDPDYDEIVNGFLSIDYDIWAVNHIYSLVQQALSSDSPNRKFAEKCVEYIITPLINSNINAEKVYVFVHRFEEWNDLSWADRVIEA